jgi:WD40 repeat protein
VAFDPQGRWLASGSEDKTVKLWDTDSGELVRTLEGHQDIVRSVAFDPQGRWLASGSDDEAVKLWDVESGHTVHSLEGHKAWVTSVAFDPNGRWLASASYDNTVRLWHVSGRLLYTLKANNGWALSVAFEPQGNWLVAGYANGAVCVWDPETGECLNTFFATPEGWAKFQPTGEYQFEGNLQGQLWHSIGLARFEPGELEPYFPHLRLTDGGASHSS